ncbi:unnamed protein product, partial [Iphiclides podalirius]
MTASCFDVGAGGRHPRAFKSRRSLCAALLANRSSAPRRLSLCYRVAARRTIDCSHKPPLSANSSVTMKRDDTQFAMTRSGSRPSRLLTDSVSSSDEPETERLLHSHPPPSMVVGCRRGSLTAPPSPNDFRKKRERHHNYMNHLHHLIHWRDRWSGEPNKAQEVEIASFLPPIHLC